MCREIKVYRFACLINRPIEGIHFPLTLTYVSSTLHESPVCRSLGIGPFVNFRYDAWLKVLPFEILKLGHQYLGNEDELRTIPEVESFRTRAKKNKVPNLKSVSLGVVGLPGSLFKRPSGAITGPAIGRHFRAKFGTIAGWATCPE